ncbi:class I SAM-dependent methyltransferase, partial [bacterium]
MLLGIWVLFTKPDRIWLQILLFSIAAHLKLYPAILFILPLWKHGSKSLLPLVVINVALLFIIGPFNAVEFVKRMSVYVQAPFLWVGNQSAASFAVLFNHTLSRWTALQVPAWIFALLPLLVWGGAVVFCWRRKINIASALWIYAISVPVMNLLPSTSHDYKLVLLYAPLAIVLYFLLSHIQKTGKWIDLLLVGALMGLALLLSTSYALLPDFLRNKYPFVLALQALFLLSMVITEEKPMQLPRLKLLPVSEYVGVNRDDPIRLYSLPIIGRLYQQRVEYCLAELAGGERVLEIGFGSGVAFFNLHEKYQEIFGLDLTAASEQIGHFFKERGIETHLMNGSVQEMPYPDNYFDSVFLVSILEHLKPADQKEAFSEIARVLKPGGQVVYG